MKHVMQWSVTKYFIISSSCSTRPDSINCAPSFRLDIDVPRLLRFSLFGSLWVAPSLYLWVRLSGKIITGTTLGSAALKAFIEQFTYGPFSITTFYIGMNLLEGNETRKAVEEAKTKFVPTWKTAVTFWPFVQTINYSLMPVHNRVVFSGIASFIWTIYLSFMKNPSS